MSVTRAAAPWLTSDSAEGAGVHFQDRVRLYLKTMCLIDLSFRAVGLVMDLAHLAQDNYQQPTLVVWLARAITLSLGLGWWLSARRALTPTQLKGLEVGCTLLVMVSNSLLYTASEIHPLYCLVASILALSLRAALVPSSVRRTVAVGLLGFGALFTVIALVDQRFEIASLWNMLIGVAFVVMTVITTRVIYGLRREVQAAMRLGQYELKRKIGEGGMGAVYEATHVLLRRPTALKLLPVEKLGAQAIARFEREVRYTSELEHPNSIYIYDYGHTPDGQFYYAMEYLEGLTLNELVEKEGQLEAPRTSAILLQAANALAEAHEKGLVHRDIKPANIMICHRGRVPDMVKVLDFGLVKSIGEPSEGQPSDEMDVTKTNMVVGTAHFLAPETIKGEEVGPAADIYALGVVAFYLLTGQQVFQGRSIMEICAQHLTALPPRPSELAERPVPADLEALVMCMLSKDPDARPQDGAALAERIEALDVPPWTPAQARRWWAMYHPVTKRGAPATATQLAIDLGEREG